MPPFDAVKKYCDTVCEQIRWKKAKPQIAAEIENHICDQRDAYIANGDDEEAATAKAVLQMGDAVAIGLELDKTHKPKPQWGMIALTGAFMLVGLLANYFIIEHKYIRAHFSVAPFIIAFCAFLLCYYADFTILGKHAMKIYLAVLAVSLIGVLFVAARGGTAASSAPIELLEIRLRERLSLIFPLVYALFVYGMRGKGYRGFLLCGAGFLPLAAVLALIPAIAGLTILTVSGLAVLCFAIAKGWFGVSKKYGLALVLAPTFAAVASAAVFVALNPNARGRLDIFLHPCKGSTGAGYLDCLVRSFLAEAVFWGKGGASQFRPNIILLPNISTDYLLAQAIHQFGFIVLLGVIAFVILFSAAAAYNIAKQKSVLGSLIALSVLLTFVMQTVLYISNTLGYGLFSAPSLPFISYGNVSLIINSALIGLMLSVFRTGDVFMDAVTERAAKPPLFSYNEGKLTIDLMGRRCRKGENRA